MKRLTSSAKRTRDDGARDRSVPGRRGDSIERRENQGPVLFRRRPFLLWHGHPCRRQRNIRDPGHPAGFGAARLQSLPSQSGRSLDELRTIASAPGWQGYLSSPARATAAHGRAIEGWWIDGATDLILRAVAGENMFVHPRLPDAVPAVVAPTIEKQLANEAASDARLENWLAQRKKR